jgi:hypothetical protein
VNHGGKMGGKHLINVLKSLFSDNHTLSEVRQAVKNEKTCNAWQWYSIGKTRPGEAVGM